LSPLGFDREFGAPIQCRTNAPCRILVVYDTPDTDDTATATVTQRFYRAFITIH
jgi:hypothetical protein